MKIAIFGTGYVGLVSGACLAQVGNHITCVDVDREKIARLQRGECPIYEPGLEPIIKETTAHGRLLFTLNAKEAIKQNNIIFIAVGTPPNEDGSADLKHVLAVAKAVGKYMNEYKVVVTKSTVLPLTGEKVEKEIRKQLAKRKKKIAFDVVSNPEFLKEGSAVTDFLKPERIIVGTNSEKARMCMESLYQPFMRQGYKVLFMDRMSAEMTKYAANAMLATRITFVNEMSRISEKIGADIENIRQGLGSDSRIGKQFLYAGPGYGGSCFPKDVKAIAKFAHDLSITPKLLDAVEEVNAQQKIHFLNKIINHFGKTLSGRTIAFWGLAFKANTDDVRESPATPIVQGLLEAGVSLFAYDPQAQKTFKKYSLVGTHKNITYPKEQYEGLKGADALVILTEWQQFRSPDFDRMKDLLKEPLIFDARNLYSLVEMEEKGFTYVSVGRKTVKS